MIIDGNNRAMGRLAKSFLLAVAAVALAQPGPPTLADVKKKVLGELSALPDYTCTETLEQWQRPARSKKFEMVERFRVDVAFVGGAEVFGWPGGEKLGEEDLTRLVGGNVANGDFALLAHSLFTSGDATFRFVREELREGRPSLRYEYSIPAGDSGWDLLAGRQRAVVGHHGTFWVDRKRLDLVELDATADRIPGPLRVKKLERVLQYARGRIGSADVPLPQLAVLAATRRNGDGVKTEVRFRNCHQYAVDTIVRFDQPDAAHAGSGVSTPVVLPEEFDVELTLEGELDSDTAAVGDPVRARLQGDIRRGREIVLPKGAVVRGRITQLPLIDGHRYFDLRWQSIESSGVSTDIRGRRNETTVYDAMRFKGLGRVPTPIPGDGARLRLPAGYRLFLKSAAP